MLQKFFTILSISLLFSSCIAHKDIVYFQGDVTADKNLKELNNQPYRLKIDDILFIDLKANQEELVSVFKNNTDSQSSTQISQGSSYFSGYAIDKQGFIEIPIVGKMNVLGYTTAEVSDKIKTELNQYFKETAGIFVTVKLAGFKYTIVGEVGSTGSKILYQNSVNIIEAIANAGDILITGDKKNVQILRPTIDGVEKFTIDLTNVSVFQSENFLLQPNDIINVPALKQKTYGTGTNGVQTLTTIISAFSLITTTVLLFKNI